MLISCNQFWSVWHPTGCWVQFFLIPSIYSDKGFTAEQTELPTVFIDWLHVSLPWLISVGRVTQFKYGLCLRPLQTSDSQHVLLCFYFSCWHPAWSADAVNESALAYKSNKHLDASFPRQSAWSVSWWKKRRRAATVLCQTCPPELNHRSGVHWPKKRQTEKPENVSAN